MNDPAYIGSRQDLGVSRLAGSRFSLFPAVRSKGVQERGENGTGRAREDRACA